MLVRVRRQGWRIARTATYLLMCATISESFASIDNHFEAIKSDPNALYAFFKAMPKSGELHYHLGGSTYAEDMLSFASTANYCINPTTLQITRPEKTCEGVLTSKLTPELYSKIIRSWSMKDFVAGNESGHDHFFGSFAKYYPIVEDHTSQLLAQIMTRASSQNELYLEIMHTIDRDNATAFANIAKGPIGFAAKRRELLSDQGFQKNINDTVAESARIINDARLALGCDALPEQPACKVKVAFQYQIMREQSLDKVFAQALNGFAAAAQSPDIVGVNLVQPEDGPIALSDYQEQMRIMNYLHSEYPSVHIDLHAGEITINDVPPADLRSHIHDAIFKGHAERIGHGVDIAREDHAEQILSHMASIPIPVEINLTSNQKILNVEGANHPLNYYLSHNVPVVLSTDDEAVLRTDLSTEYMKAVFYQGLDYTTIKNINRNGLTYSFLPGKSLWANSRTHQAVEECQDLTSDACKQFIKNNQKARIEWMLEKKLAMFESNF